MADQPFFDPGSLIPMDRAARIEKVRASLDPAGCDALVVTKPVNIRWLCGFTGSSGTVIVSEDSLAVVTDGRYEEQIEQQLSAAGVQADVSITRDIREPVLDAAAGANRVGLESDHVSWADQRRFSDWFEGRELVATSDLIEGSAPDQGPG